MRKMRLRIAKEAVPFLGILALAVGLLLWLVPILSILPLALVVFTAFFYRDPSRTVPSQENAIIAPADGLIVGIEEAREDRLLHGTTTRVSIFLSLLDVHQNRAPTAGQVVYLAHQNGRFRPAFSKSAGAQNERNYIGMKSRQGNLLVVQVAGILARRIVCRVTEGEVVEVGQKIGMIRFGSRTELYLPKEKTQVLVRTGQHVRAGETIMGSWIQ